MSAGDALAAIKTRADRLAEMHTRELANRLPEFGREYTLLAGVESDHRRLLAALEAVEAYMAEQEARPSFPDASEIDKSYSLGRRHSYRAIRAAIEEALS